MSFLEENINVLTKGAVKHLYNNEIGFFESGERNQLSWHSQIWMILAGVFEKDANANLKKTNKLRH